jgi:hypothetical protein
LNVIAPRAKESGSGVDGGFFLSVQMDSCGAVKIGAATQDPRALAPAPTDEDDSRIFDGEVIHGPKDVPEPVPVLSEADRRHSLLQAARAKLAAAREAANGGGVRRPLVSEEVGGL